MKNKIIGIVICILLISSTTTLAFTPFRKVEQQTKNQLVQKPLIPLLISGGWMKTFGGIKNDYGKSVQQTIDGGYIVSGSTSSYGAGDTDVWVIKTDSNGNEEWNKTFGGTYSDDSCSIQKTMDGGYIIIGGTRVIGPNLWLIKIDKNGIEEWNKVFGGPGPDAGRYVQQTADSGYIIVGFTHSFGKYLDDIWLIKTDNTGNKIWERTFGRIGYDAGLSVQQIVDGGYIITGDTLTSDLSNYDLWLIKTNKDGNEIWNKTFGGANNDCGMFVQQTTDGGYVITGSTSSYGSGDSDVWVIKTDSNGNEEWNKTFGGTYSDDSYSIQQTNDGGFILTGYTSSFGSGVQDVWLIKTDSNGDTEWDRKFGGIGSDLGWSVQQTTDNGYIIAGTTCLNNATDYNVWLIKADENGFVSNPPNPPIITGPEKEPFGISTVYNFTAIDPEDDVIYYFIDWGDNTNSGWIGPYPSGEQITQSHTWSTKGTYTIKAKAKDPCNESDWATFTVKIPYSYTQPMLQFFEWLFQRFPNVFPLLRQLTGY